MIDSVSQGAGGLNDLRRARRRKAPSDLKTDRMPPHSPEMEQGILGCMLEAPNDCVSLCIAKLKEGMEVFYDLRHQTIYEEIVQMYDKQTPIDVITVQQQLKDRQLLEQIGGIPYLNSLIDNVISTANITYYIDIVYEKYLLRKLISTCSDVVGKVYEFEGNVDQLFDECERDLLAIRATSAKEIIGTKTLVNNAISKIEEYHKNQGKIIGLATGYPDFDKATDGLHPGEMIVIAGRPSMGKTTLAMNIAEHIALNLKLPVGVFSLEMTADNLMLRSLCTQARVNLRTIKGGFITESDFPKLTSAAGRLSNAPLTIDDTPGLSIIEFRARARRMCQEHGLKLLVVDYLQLLHGVTKKSDENRQTEVAEISSGIKSLAKELGIPIIVLSQLNREMEKEKSRKPRLADLRESGAIEQDADVVGLLYKPGETNAEQNSEEDGLPINLLIAKQRNGPAPVDIHFTFLKSITRFESASKIDERDVPHKREPYND